MADTLNIMDTNQIMLYCISMILDSCKIGGCSTLRRSKGMCMKHYNEWRAKNSPNRCSMDGCNSHVQGNGLCSKHYQKSWVYGCPSAKRNGRGLDLINKTIKSPPEDCVIWPYSKVRGYGRLKHSGKIRGAHVVVLEMVKGPCPEGKECAHECGARDCINPNHLSWKTPKENSADKEKHGTLLRGIDNPRAKLHEEQVKSIRGLYDAGGTTEIELAELFEVSRRNIRAILDRDHWRHV